MSSGFLFIEDHLGKTPLTYAFEYKNLKCVDEIVKFINDSDQDFIITKKDFQYMF